MGKVIDFNKRKAENIEEKSRQFERIFFTELIGCYSEIENGERIFQIQVLDISETGCLIEIPRSSGGLPHFEIGSDVFIRLYFTKKSFITLRANIVRSVENLNDEKVRVYQFGAQFDVNSQEFDVFNTFISFIRKFAEHSHVDNSSKKVYFF